MGCVKLLFFCVFLRVVFLFVLSFLFSGMNVVNGLETSHLAFYALLGGSAAASAAALGGVMKHLRSDAVCNSAGENDAGKRAAAVF